MLPDKRIYQSPWYAGRPFLQDLPSCPCNDTSPRSPAATSSVEQLLSSISDQCLLRQEWRSINECSIHMLWNRVYCLNLSPSIFVWEWLYAYIYLVHEIPTHSFNVQRFCLLGWFRLKDKVYDSQLLLFQSHYMLLTIHPIPQNSCRAGGAGAVAPAIARPIFFASSQVECIQLPQE